MRKILTRERSCTLCLLEDIEKYELAYKKKEKTLDKICNELDIDKYNWYKHMRHVEPALLASVNDQRTELAEQYFDTMGDLLKLLETQKIKAELITTEISGNADPKLINAWVSVNSEIRKTIETFSKLNGDLKTHSETTNNTVNIEYGQIVEHVLQESCMACKIKLNKSLPMILKKIE